MNAEKQTHKPYFLPGLLAAALHVLIIFFLVFELTFPQTNLSSGSPSSSIIQAAVINPENLDRLSITKPEESAFQFKKKIILQKKTSENLSEQSPPNTANKLDVEKENQINQEKIRYLQQIEKSQEKLRAEKILQKNLDIQKKQNLKKMQEKITEKKQQQAQEIQKKKIKMQQQTQMKKALQQSLKADLKKQLLKEEQQELNQNEAKKAAQENQTQAQGEIDRYKSLIIRVISQQWTVPENLPQDISCELRIQVAPGGIILDVSVLKSSGNVLLDNSAVLAVKKASPLPVPASISLFNQFRELHLTVKPDGSMID